MKNKSGGINIGTSSILVTFVLLALVTFASLSYLSAQSDYTLSKEAADRTACFYDANRMAEIYMSNIEELLSREMQKNPTEEEYYGRVASLFADNDRIQVVNRGKKPCLQYVVTVTEGQNLEVELVANYPSSSDARLVIVDKWATAINNEWLQQVRDGDKEKSGVKFLF